MTADAKPNSVTLYVYRYIVVYAMSWCEWRHGFLGIKVGYKVPG